METGFPEFTTFSVGEGEDRRTVVCFQQQLLDYTLGNIRWEKARDTGEYVDHDVGGVMVHHDNDRLDTNFLTDSCAGSDHVADTPAVVSTQPCQEQFSSDTSPAGSPARNNKKSSTSSSPTSSSKNRKKRPERAVYVPPVGRGKPLSAEAAEFKPNSPVGHVLAGSDVTEVDGTRDVTEQVVSEITTALGGVQIESPSVDYSSFQTSDSTINIDQFGHVIELYDFPSEMKTNDLMNAFSAFTSRCV